MPEEMKGTKRMEVLAEALLEIATLAAKEILKVYHQSDTFEVTLKPDESPVTRADLAANGVIVEALQALTPGVPILTEEASMEPFAQRRRWREYWIVDPLDGTKEFIRRNDQFTVNIALINGHRPVLGLVYLPVSQVAYIGIANVGARKISPERNEVIKCRSICNRLSSAATIEVVASMHHSTAATEDLISKLEKQIAPIERRSIGSSLKFCLLAEGLADIYPRLAPTSEWDTAAAQAVLDAAGGAVYQLDASVLLYNTKESILNPHFIAVADPGYNWRSVLGIS